MPNLTGIEAANTLLASLRALWAVHADFAGVDIEAPRLNDIDKRVAGDKLISLAIPGIQIREKTTAEAPRAWIQDATLQVYVLVESAFPVSNPSGDPAAAVLDALNPLAISTQKRIEIDLHALQEPQTPTAMSKQFLDWGFDSYTAGVDNKNSRLQALGVFEYSLGFYVPEYFDNSELVDLTGIDVDYQLYGGIGNTLFPDPPQAQDDETLP